jgi:hypothetical protein
LPARNARYAALNFLVIPFEAVLAELVRLFHFGDVIDTFSDLSRRHDKLSWSHHREVASLSADEADDALALAEKEEWSQKGRGGPALGGRVAPSEVARGDTRNNRGAGRRGHGGGRRRKTRAYPACRSGSA